MPKRSQENYKKYTDEQIERANSTDIYELAKYRGYEVRDKNSRLAEIRHQSGLDIDRMSNKWYCHGAHKGGGPIQLVMFMEDISWLEAVKGILNEDGEVEIFRPPKQEIQEDKSMKAFELPEKNNSYRRMFAYLVKSRFIDASIVNDFVKKKLIYENSKGSCVFVGCDKDNIPRYAAIRGTNTSASAFKGEAAQSDKRFSFSRVGSNHILTVVEAPIDLLSYMSIYKLHGLERMIEHEHLLSLGGVSDIALAQYLFDHPEITHIQLALDNDEAGNESCKRIYSKYSSMYHIKRINMKEKDMNMVLVKDIERIAIARREQMEVKEVEELEAEVR